MKVNPDVAMHAFATRDSHASQPLALVFSHTPSADLGTLTSRRCTSALPFGGRYRLIDFALSNCANSGIEHVGVIARYQPRSLRAHLVYGRPRGLDRCQEGLALLLPYETQAGTSSFRGGAGAIYQNWEFISRHQADRVLILAGDEVHTMDLRNLIAQHHKMQADLTVAAVSIAGKAASRYHTLVIDREGWVRELARPGTSEPGTLALMGTLLFSTEALGYRLREDVQQPDSTHDLFRDVIPAMIEAGDRVMAFQHAGYWNSVQNVRDYWQASMDLLGQNPSLNLQDGAWPIYTRPGTQPPVRIAEGSVVSRSLISEGCIIEGSVEGSVLSPGVQVAAGAVVRNAVVMHDTVVEERALVENAILDADVIVGPQARVGEVSRHAPTLGGSLFAPLTVVGEGTRIPARATIRPHSPSKDLRLPDRRNAPAQLLTLRPEPVVDRVAVGGR